MTTRRSPSIDWKIILSGANFVALLGLLATGLGSWNSLTTAVTRTDVIVTEIQRRLERLDTTTLTAANALTAWQQDIIVRLARLEVEIKRLADNAEQRSRR